MIHKKICRYLMLMLLLANSSYCNPLTLISARIDSLYEAVISQFGFLPEYYLKSDLSTFAFQKDTYFKQQYLAESNTGLELEFLSFRDLLYSIWDVKFKIGLGDIPGNNVFSVLNIHFIITPTVELRLRSLNVIVGFEHQCVHEVDRKNYTVIYWNSPFLALGSKNMRVNDYWVPLAAENGWTFKNRWAWYISYVNYLKEGFGIVDPNKLNGSNSYVQEIRTDTRYAVYKRKAWIVTIHEQFRLGQYERLPGIVDNSGVYWREDIGAESYFCKGKRGAALWAKFIWDDVPAVRGLPVFSKDKLLEIGVSFFN